MVANFTVLVPKTKQYWEAMGGNAETGSMLTNLLPLLKAVMAWAFLRLSYTRSVTAVISTMIAGNILGNLVFAMAPVTDSRWMVFIARMILTSHEVQSVPNCYIGRAVGARYRSEAAMHNNAWFALGYAAGPVIAYLLENAAKALGVEDQGVDVLDAETLPGWFMAIVWLLFLIIHRKCFEEPALEDGEHPDAKRTNLLDLNWVGIALVCLSSFVTAVTMSSWEMFTMHMAQDRWGSPLVAGGYLASVTLAILPVAMLSGRLSKLVDDNIGLCMASTTAFASWALLFNYFRAPYYEKPTAQIFFYTCGSICLLASLQLTRGFLDALVSKLNPPCSKQKLITAVMSIFMLGRGVGGALGASFINQNSWAGLHMSACALTAFLLLGSVRFLQPWEVFASAAAAPARVHETILGVKE